MTKFPHFPARDLRKKLGGTTHARAFGDNLEGDRFRLSFAIGGSMQAPMLVSSSIALLTQDFRSTEGTHVNSTIIIANGDVELLGQVGNCLVVCDGERRCR